MSEIMKNIIDRANRNVNSTVFAADEVLVLAAEIERLTAALATAEETGRRKGISQAAMTADNTRWRHRPGANQKNVEVINRITGAFGKVIADYIRSLMDKPTT